jgi:hypothetical protein
VFEDWVLRRIVGHKRDEVTEEWRKRHNEELHDLYSHPILCGDKIEKNEMGGACSEYGEERILVGKPEGKRPMGRPRRIWKDNIKMGLLEVGWVGMDWIGLA